MQHILDCHQTKCHQANLSFRFNHLNSWHHLYTQTQKRAYTSANLLNVYLTTTQFEAFVSVTPTKPPSLYIFIHISSIILIALSPNLIQILSSHYYQYALNILYYYFETKNKFIQILLNGQHATETASQPISQSFCHPL